MLYVNGDGELQDSEGREVNLKTKFFDASKVAPFSVLAIVGRFSNLHQALNHLIESVYKVNITRISRTEKNKGRDYASSAYTVTADLDYIGDPNDKKLKDFITQLYTFRGASINFFNFIKEHLECINESYSIKDFDVSLYSKDYALYHYLEESDRIILQLNPIEVYGLREVDSFKLDSMDQAIYLSFITKFMEIYGNYAINNEVSYYYNNYEMWLYSVFNKYFISSIIKDFYNC